jgi:hypothetical protein
MGKLFLFIGLLFTTLTGLSQAPKRKIVEGSLMVFHNGNTKMGIGASTPPFITFNITKDLRIGPALQAVAYKDFKTGQYDWNKGGMALRIDYKRICFSYDIAMISNVENRFIGIGIKF